MYKKNIHIHFVGIGGIGMSGIAKILRYQGYTISGCDTEIDQHNVTELKNIGCIINQGNNNDFCKNAPIDILVYSSAIESHNEEIKAAQARTIPTIPRAIMLAELMRTKFSIGIAGSHGKTTTTSLISHILIEAKKDPTVIVGGRLKALSTNAQFGLGDFLVAEADESDRSLIHLQATLAVVTNISLEHLDTYIDIEDIKKTFKHFLNNLPFYGTAVVCIDNEHVQDLLPLMHCKTIKYSFTNDQADVYAQNVALEGDYSLFDLYYKQEFVERIMLNIPGKHNILNSLAAIAIARELDISFEDIRNALKTFKGVERRFSYHGLYKGAEVFDDYGHHPEEIINTVAVATKRKKNKLTMVFEPHRYSRTHKLWNLFLERMCELPLDNLIITDIYPASEEPIKGITAEAFMVALQEKKPPYTLTYAPYDSEFSYIRQALDSVVDQDDLVLIQGAGKINKLVKKLM